MFVPPDPGVRSRLHRIAAWLRAFVLLEDPPVSASAHAAQLAPPPCAARLAHRTGHAVAARPDAARTDAAHMPGARTYIAPPGIARTYIAPPGTARTNAARTEVARTDTGHGHPHREPLRTTLAARRPNTPPRPIAHCLTPVAPVRPQRAPSRTRTPHIG
jgi:hypothetical protein